MNELAALIDGSLPLNRKERYFTGTVFPMIVCKENFRYFDRLLPLVGLDGFAPYGFKWGTGNMVFYTEYSLQESLVTEADKARFDIPGSKDTPDIVMYISEPRPVIIALEAKVFHNPAAATLRAQMDGQTVFLDAMKDALGAECRHYALIPQALLDAYGGEFAGDAIAWEALARAYADTAPDYFLDMLNLALERYPALVSKGVLSYGANCDGYITGWELYNTCRNPNTAIASVGRDGGLHGAAFIDDVSQGTWKSRKYEYSSGAPANRNWFTIEEFLKAVGGEEAAML